MNLAIREGEIAQAIKHAFSYGNYVNLTGRVNKLKGYNVRKDAAPSLKPIGKVKFNEFVFIDREYWPQGKKITKLGWYHIYNSKGLSGWIRSDGLNIYPMGLPLDTGLKVVNPSNKLEYSDANSLKREIAFFFKNSIYANSLWDIAHLHYQTKSKFWSRYKIVRWGNCLCE